MMNVIKKFALVLLLTIIAGNSYSQGCSDAGFCTMGSLKPASGSDSLYRQKAKLSFGFGAGEEGVSIIQVIPELELGLFNRNAIQIKIPYTYANGDLGSNSGIGDLSLSMSQQMLAKGKSQLAVTIGVKIPIGTTDASDGNPSSLPMPYQTGLGTTDLVLGAAFGRNKWNIGLGYQKVLKNDNQNSFLRVRYLLQPEAASYFESNRLKRGDDMLLRVEKRFDFSRFAVTPGLLAIYRLEEDKITRIDGVETGLKGSDGVTLNITANATYAISEKINLNLLIGAPAIVRETRPDGLTRSMVVNFGFQYNFKVFNK